MSKDKTSYQESPIDDFDEHDVSIGYNFINLLPQAISYHIMFIILILFSIIIMYTTLYTLHMHNTMQSPYFPSYMHPPVPHTALPSTWLHATIPLKPSSIVAPNNHVVGSFFSIVSHLRRTTPRLNQLKQSGSTPLNVKESYV